MTNQGKSLDENKIASRDTTFDNVIPKSLWITVSNCGTDGKLEVNYELNGIKREIFLKWPDHCKRENGIVLESTNLSWMLKSTQQSCEDIIGKMEEALKDISKNYIGHPTDLKNSRIEIAKEILAELALWRKNEGKL